MCQDHVVSCSYMTAFVFGLPEDDDLSPKHIGELLFMDDL